MSIFDDNRSDEIRAKIDFKRNPPQNAPGQGDSMGWNMNNDSFDNSSGDFFSNSGDAFGDFNSNSFSSGNNSGNPFLGSSNGSSGLEGVYSNNSGVNVQGQGYSGNFNPYVQNGPKEKLEIEDVISKGVVAGGKSLFNIFNALVEETKEAVRDNQEVDMFIFGGHMLHTGLVVAGIGLILFILSKFLSGINEPACSAIFLSGGLSCMIGAIFYALKGDAAREYMEALENGTLELEGEDSYTEEDNFPEENNFFDNENDNDDFNDENTFEEDSNDEEEDSYYSNDEDEEEEDDSYNVVVNNENIGDKLEEIEDDPSLNPGLFTRSLLFEKWSEILPQVTPNFSNLKELDSDDPDYLMFTEYLEDAADAVGISEENYPEIELLTKGLFTYKIKCTRKHCTGKEQKIADEVVSMYIKNPNTGVILRERAASYATVSTSGKYFFIDLFIGSDDDKDSSNKIAVSLGDMYKNSDTVKDFVLNKNIKMPYVWGIDESGIPIISDFFEMESIIFSGATRSGKSWKVQSTLLQMSLYTPPSELDFYICDTKNQTSDYIRISKLLPHVKKFAGTKEDILNTVRWLVDEEADRRGNILRKSDSISIKDYNRKNPDKPMSYIYLVVDEMMSLMKEMSKDEKNEFNSYAVRIVSKYPNLGFRAIFIPHRIHNDFISKDIYALVKNKVGIRSNFEELKGGLEITNKNFPYKLPNVGDMAVKSDTVNEGSPTFCHAEVITTSNEENLEVFSYVGRVWEKLDPDCVKKEKQGNSFSSYKGSSNTQHVPKQRGSKGSNSPIDDVLDEIGEEDLDDFWN